MYIKKKMINKLIKSSNTGILIGNISDNEPHKHYALQLIISLSDNITISSGNQNYDHESLTIKPLIRGFQA